MLFNHFAPLFVQKYERYLPTAFDESMSLLQKTNTIIKYMNDLGLTVNEVVEEWNKVVERLQNDGLTTAINDRLDKMSMDGTLDKIINVAIFEDLNSQMDIAIAKVNQLDNLGTTNFIRSEH